MKNLVAVMLNRDPTKRPRVHEILAMPVIKDRIKEFLTKTQQNMEFNHTIIHKKDLNQIYQEEKIRNQKFDLKDNSKLLKEKDERERLEKEHKEKEKEKLEKERIKREQQNKVQEYTEHDSDRLKSIDNKLDQLRREREERKQMLEDNKLKREEERKEFLKNLKQKHEGDPNKEEVRRRSDCIDSSSSRTDLHTVSDVDFDEKPCGINETEVNQNDYEEMNECMMNVFLESQPKPVENEDDQDEEDEQLDQNMLDKINLSASNEGDGNFSGDIQHF